MMEKMKLSEAEKKGVRVKKGGEGGSWLAEPQAIGKVLADRLVFGEGLAQALGKIWCPIRDIDCKDLGSNHFLFTFHQTAGKRRALEDGPWVFGKDLIIVVDFDGRKHLEDIRFEEVPIWIRVSGMPLGMTNKETGIAIVNVVGHFVDMDLEEDGSAVGKYLRIKVKLNVKKPLMRGVLLMEDDDEEPGWCPIVYEFLPEFCYTCSIIGHTDKACAVVLVEGEKPQFSKKLRFLPEKKRWDEGLAFYPGGLRRSGHGDMEVVEKLIALFPGGRVATNLLNMNRDSRKTFPPKVHSPTKEGTNTESGLREFGQGVR